MRCPPHFCCSNSLGLSLGNFFCKQGNPLKSCSDRHPAALSNSPLRNTDFRRPNKQWPTRAHKQPPTTPSRDTHHSPVPTTERSNLANPCHWDQNATHQHSSDIDGMLQGFTSDHWTIRCVNVEFSSKMMPKIFNFTSRYKLNRVDDENFPFREKCNIQVVQIE